MSRLPLHVAWLQLLLVRLDVGVGQGGSFNRKIGFVKEFCAAWGLRCLFLAVHSTCQTSLRCKALARMQSIIRIYPFL